MRTVLTALFSVLFLVIGGCNTVEGFGRDVEETGEAIENSSD